MAPPATGTAIRPQHREVVGLRGDDLLLNLCQQLLPFGERQTQRGDIVKAIGPVESHEVETWRLTIDLSSNQPQNPPHSGTPRQHPDDRIALVVIPPIAGQSLQLWFGKQAETGTVKPLPSDVSRAGATVVKS